MNTDICQSVGIFCKRIEMWRTSEILVMEIYNWTIFDLSTLVPITHFVDIAILQDRYENGFVDIVAIYSNFQTEWLKSHNYSFLPLLINSDVH
jgi:hypothetical protein